MSSKVIVEGEESGAPTRRQHLSVKALIGWEYPPKRASCVPCDDEVRPVNRHLSDRVCTVHYTDGGGRGTREVQHWKKSPTNHSDTPRDLGGRAFPPSRALGPSTMAWIFAIEKRDPLELTENTFPDLSA